MIEVDLEITRTLTELFLDESISDTVKSMRLSALRQINSIMTAYYREFHNEGLVAAICRKKIGFIMNATTKKELAEIMADPRIRYDGAKFRPANQFSIPEEELLAWSRASLVAPLNSAGSRRFEELFTEVFPEYADIISSY